MTKLTEERVREIVAQELAERLLPPDDARKHNSINMYAKGRRDGWLYAIGVGGFLLAVFLLFGGSARAALPPDTPTEPPHAGFGCAYHIVAVPVLVDVATQLPVAQLGEAINAGLIPLPCPQELVGAQ